MRRKPCAKRLVQRVRNSQLDRILVSKYEKSSAPSVPPWLRNESTEKTTEARRTQRKATVSLRKSLRIHVSRSRHIILS